MFFLPMRRTVQEHLGFPIAPGGWPVIGHMPLFFKDMLGFMRQAEQSLGKFYWTDAGFGMRTLVCSEPEVINALRNKTTTSEHLAELSERFLGQSLLVHDGVHHLRMRSSMNAPFTPKGLSATEIGPVMAETIETRVKRLAPGNPYRILAETRELALSVIFRMIGIPADEFSQWRHHYEEFMMSVINIPINLPGFPAWRGERGRRWLDVKLNAIIENVRQNPDPSKLLTQLVQGKDEQGNGLTGQELLDNLRLLVLAGHETTASTMAWMTLHLGRDPELWDRLVQEAMAGEGVPRFPKDLKSFPLAEALFREALRLYPPAHSTGRRVVGEFSVAGRTIPVGVDLTIPIALLSRDPSHYHEPDVFRVDRWLEKKEAIQPLELIQFGGGPHFCLGYHVAWMEAVQYAVSLARHLGSQGLRPLHEGEAPRVRYVPLTHPDKKTEVRIVKR